MLPEALAETYRKLKPLFYKLFHNLLLFRQDTTLVVPTPLGASALQRLR